MPTPPARRLSAGQQTLLWCPRHTRIVVQQGRMRAQFIDTGLPLPSRLTLHAGQELEVAHSGWFSLSGAPGCQFAVLEAQPGQPLITLARAAFDAIRARLNRVPTGTQAPEASAHMR